MSNEAPKYSILQNNAFLQRQSTGYDPKTGIDSVKLHESRRPTSFVESLYIENTDGLIGVLDGSIDTQGGINESSEIIQYTDFEGLPADYVIYLDKSARPIRKLVHGLWSLLGKEGSVEPKARFLNIDKEPWLISMGFDRSSVQNIDPSMVDLSRINQGQLDKDLLSIRALFVRPELLNSINESNLESVRGLPTVLDGKNVSITDEVRSSGNTLRIALMIMQQAIPEARYCASYWATPRLIHWNRLVGNEAQDEFCAEYAPVWYDANTAYGRGIDDIDPSYSLRSKSKLQRIGSRVLSTPYHDHKSHRRVGLDSVTRMVNGDLDLLIERAKSRKALIVPSRYRNYEDFFEKSTWLNGMTFEEFRAAREKLLK